MGGVDPGFMVVLAKKIKDFKMRQIFGVVRSSKVEEKNLTIKASN